MAQKWRSFLNNPQAADAQSLWGIKEKQKVEERLAHASLGGCLALSDLLKTSVRTMRHGILEAVSSSALPLGFFPSHELIYNVSQFIQGDLNGIATFAYSQTQTKPLLDSILAANGLAGNLNNDAMKKSILEEATNIFVNALLKDFGALFRMESYSSVPVLEVLEWGKSWEKLLRIQSFDKKGVILHSDISWGLSQKLGYFLFSLSRDASENLRFWAQEGKSAMVPVSIGSLEIATAPTVLRASDLGSCVAAIIYDPTQKKGGMAHVMLAQNPSKDAVILRPGKYADTAIPALVSQIRAKGKLSAFIAGGASMPMASSVINGTIGPSNAEVLRSEIKKAGIFLVGEEIGGAQARTVELLTATGEIRITQGSIQRIKKLI